MYRKVVALLGIGGVGKTTFTYKVLGLSEVSVLTLRPSYYRIYTSAT
jgi:adenylate kinase